MKLPAWWGFGLVCFVLVLILILGPTAMCLHEKTCFGP